ncbi:MAG: flagellar biosynthesis protein FlhA [Alphaproteobacteria bacterium]|nr:flagellar biosynthesis protein FlhA [Alphaproteobacteria bacterium]
MAEATIATRATTGGAGVVNVSWDMLKRGDLSLALGIMAIIAVLLFPVPTFLLDIALGISITLSVLILMTALFIERPLQLSTFPTILLISTMLRLSLNLASTKLILTYGHEGTAAAGHVIEAFGNLLMQGNFVIGIIVFVILIIVNFVVITKGSGRIAEVSARFTLDAMPGKQMAIDADLSAGLINEKDARERRKRLEDEANFYGSMDGASKFVRGDAIAGILITFINIIGGIIIGVGQHGMDFSNAAHAYTLLTIGDGLVTQIPALLVSIAAGLMVSKAGVDGAADKALVAQLSDYPQALGMSSFVMGLMAFLPGIPTLIFLGLAAGAGGLAYLTSQRKENERDAEKSAAASAEQAKAPADEPIQTALAMDYLKVELGYGLLPLINDAKGHRLTDQIKALRRQMASEMGFVMPSVRIIDNMQLASNDYVIRVKELQAGKGELQPGQMLVMDPRGGQIDLPGRPTREPAFGLPAAWVDERFRDEASFRGFTVVDPATVLTTHLTELLKENMAELLSYAETKKLLDDLPAENKKLVDDLIPSQITVTGIQRILQSLLAERISIRDLATILEGIAEAASRSSTTLQMAEHVRSRLARQISSAHTSQAGYLPLIALSPAWEQAFADSLIGQGDEKQLALAPSKLQEFIQSVRARFDAAANEGELPVLLTSPLARPYVRSIIERFRAQTFVMSQNEIHPSARLRTLGQI